MLLLPSSDTKQLIWEKYREAAESCSQRIIGLSRFKSLWQQHFPNIQIAKPRSDLCWKCMKYNNAIMKGRSGQKTKVITYKHFTITVVSYFCNIALRESTTTSTVS